MEGRDLSVPFGKIIERYSGIVEGLGLKLSLKDEFDSIRSAMLHRAGRDYVASRGEYLNAKILAEYLGFTFVDPSWAVCFDQNGVYDAILIRIRQTKFFPPCSAATKPPLFPDFTEVCRTVRLRRFHAEART